MGEGAPFSPIDDFELPCKQLEWNGVNSIMQLNDSVSSNGLDWGIT